MDGRHKGSALVSALWNIHQLNRESKLYMHMCLCVCVCLCACVCEREGGSNTSGLGKTSAVKRVKVTLSVGNRRLVTCSPSP